MNTMSESQTISALEDVADIYINHGGKLIRLGDVAYVTTGERERRNSLIRR